MFALKDEIASYLERCSTVRRLSGHTLAAYRADLYQFASHVPEGATAAPSEMREALKRIAGEQRYAPATVRRKIAAVRAFLRSADEALEREIFAGWKLKVRMPARLPKALPRRVLQDLLTRTRTGAGSEEQSTYLCLALLAATGLRVSELCALNVADVLTDSGEIKVYGKGARERIVVVANKQVRAALANYIARRPPSGPAPEPLFRNRGAGHGLAPNACGSVYMLLPGRPAQAA